MSERAKKLLLVFPPLTVPTAPPLGVALLKGYIERELPQWQVVILDLNVWLFNRLLQPGSLRGKLNRTTFPEAVLAEVALEKGAEVFRGGSQATEFYTAPERYDLYGELFSRFTHAFGQELAGYCRDFEHDAAPHPLITEMIGQIIAQKPHCVGLSLSYGDQLPAGITIGRILRKKFGLKVIMGGSVFSGSPQQFLTTYPDVADLVVAGEGEAALKQYLSDGLEPAEVPGGNWLHNGLVRGNAPELCHDLDRLSPPDFSDCNLNNYYSPRPVIPLLLSRGCYWRRCTFCAHYRSAGMTYRRHGIDYVIAMLRGFTERGIRHFAFIDEMISPAYFQKLAKGIREAGLDIAYYALARPEKAFTPELLRQIAASGCRFILWGVESACQRILDLMDKGTQVAEVRKVLHDSAAAGIANHVYIICGFPTETPLELAETVKFLMELRGSIHGVHRGPFVLQKDTPIYDAPEKYAITRVGVAGEDVLGGRCDFEVASGMTPTEAREIFNSLQPVFRAFSPYAPHLPNFRDHALLVYDKAGVSLRPDRRIFPHIVYPDGSTQG